MQKALFKTFRLPAWLFLLTVLLAPLGAQAKSYLTESFRYSAGNLYGQGNWLRNGKQAEAPIQLVPQPLAYPGYQTAAAGFAVELGGEGNAQDERLMKRFVEEGEPKMFGIKEGSLYMSALVNVKEAGGIATTEQMYILGFIPESTSGNKDQVSYSLYSRLFVIGSETEGKFKFGLSKANGNAEPEATTEELNLGETYLVVMKYEIVEGTGNDIVTLWINPATGQEPEAVLTTSNKTDISATMGITGLSLYQGGSSVRKAPHALVDAIRVADTWDELFREDEVGEVTPPVQQAGISVNKKTQSFATFAGLSTAVTLNVKATGLTEDITVSGLSAPYSASATVIDKEAALSAAGADLTVTYAPTAAGSTSATLILTSGDATQEVMLSGQASATVSIPTSTALNNQKADGEEVYLYTGKATVTHIDAANNRVYAQDMMGALCVDFSYTGQVPVQVGDVMTKVAGGLIKEFGVPYLMAYMPTVTVTSTGASKEPSIVTVGDLLASPESYIHRLVKIEDVTFTPTEGQTFGTATVKGKAGDKDVTVLPFSGTTLTGTPVPETATVVGISRSMSIASISPRGAEDVIAPQAETALNITPEMVFTGEAAPINADTELMRYTVEAVNLPHAVSIYLTGANRTMYTLSTEEIPAGTSTTVVTVTYHPTAIGKHTGRINFDTTPTELATGYQFTNLAYDPENLPFITVEPATLPAFSAKVGENQVQELTVTGANFPDNGAIKVMGEGQGAFIISSTLLGKYAPMTLKVTFQPKAEGTFTERIQFTGVMAEPVYVTVTGSTTGGQAPEEKQGDELPLVTDNPLTLLNETFADVTRNQPVSLQGWKNLALQGTRAWWGFNWNEPEANTAAKATAYDSRMATEDGEPCQMMLVTPPLDFKNSASKMLTFRIMGDMLEEGMTDQLEVCYIDMEDGEMYVEPIKGLGIPASADYNGEWRDYVMDLEGNDLSDTFFIGFRLTSTRGRNNSAVYYIDDVTYGRTDVPFIKPETLTGEFIATAGADHTETYRVEGRNLTGVISLSVGGANAGKFSVSPATLPAEGGEFTVTFHSDEIGIHEAEVVFTADGAPASAMLLTAHNREGIRADFTAQECTATIYGNGFDTAEDFAAWTLSPTSTSTWKRGTLIYGVPAFSSIQADSRSSLVIEQDGSKQDESITSPAIAIPQNAQCSFYSAFAGIWLYYGSYKLYVNTGDGQSHQLFDSFLWAQDNAVDEARWRKFTFDLAPYAGQTVTFTFAYEGTGGEDMMIDDFRVMQLTTGEDARVSISEGEDIHLTDLSTGNPVKWEWSMPGAETETSAEQNPTAVYPAAGTYDVTLTVTDAEGNTSTLTREGFVTVTMQAPQAVIGLPEGGYLSPFASIFVPTQTPLTFTDLSAGNPTDRTWTFTGTDITTSGESEVSVTYPTAGTYSVDLEVSNAAGTSKTYYEGICAGGEQYIWNIEVSENTSLAPVTLGYYGYYGGTNWLGMEAFGERFEKPMTSGKISSVDVYFAQTATVTPDADITVSVMGETDGLPGNVLATATVKAGDLKSGEYEPTTFTFDAPVAVSEAFFITVSGIPANTQEEYPYAADDIAIYCSPRRADGGKSTVYHLLAEEDENYQPTGETKWYKNEDEFLSFAIAPKFAYEEKEQGNGIADATAEAAGTLTVVADNGRICISAATDIDAIALRNMAGMTVATAAPSAATATVPTAGLAKGVYLVSVKMGQTVVTRKITL
ncbi:MAG: choice-of-anchor J domain-containing protein [Clostridium sp.]|nr:choice-of-anchor J domain-containing protein [Clostridium sp.]